MDVEVRRPDNEHNISYRISYYHTILVTNTLATYHSLLANIFYRSADAVEVRRPDKHAVDLAAGPLGIHIQWLHLHDVDIFDQPWVAATSHMSYIVMTYIVMAQITMTYVVKASVGLQSSRR